MFLCLHDALPFTRPREDMPAKLIMSHAVQMTPWPLFDMKTTEVYANMLLKQDFKYTLVTFEQFCVQGVDVSA